MGLDCSHDAFHGAYSAFNRLRQEVARAIGGSFPPHWKYDDKGLIAEDFSGLAIYDRSKDASRWYHSDAHQPETHPGLFEFMAHSDCDGEISPEMCVKVANDLEALLPAIQALNSEATGHIAAQGGYVEVVKKFIAGCRAAAKENAPLDFH